MSFLMASCCPQTKPRLLLWHPRLLLLDPSIATSCLKYKPAHTDHLSVPGVYRIVFLLQGLAPAAVCTPDARNIQTIAEHCDKCANPVETAKGVFRKQVQLLGTSEASEQDFTFLCIGFFERVLHAHSTRFKRCKIKSKSSSCSCLSRVPLSPWETTSILIF